MWPHSGVATHRWEPLTGLEVHMARDSVTDLDQTTDLMSNTDVNQEITQTSVSLLPLRQSSPAFWKKPVRPEMVILQAPWAKILTRPAPQWKGVSIAQCNLKIKLSFHYPRALLHFLRTLDFWTSLPLAFWILCSYRKWCTSEMLPAKEKEWGMRKWSWEGTVVYCALMGLAFLSYALTLYGLNK